MRRYSQTRRQRGFTLTEILVAISIFSIVMIAALVMYDRNSRVFKSGVENADAQQNTRVAFDKLVADLRMMGYDYDRDGFPTTAVATVWQANTAYDPGNIIIPTTPNGFTYLCITGGTSGASQPSWSTTVGEVFSDGATVSWQTSTTSNQFQQPDEQLEYAGPTAITLRGNFDYEIDSANENGREVTTGYQSAQFPVVTTANDEIVTYALVSKTAAANDDSISFYVDMNAAGSSPSRTAYPGGTAERQVTINGVDTSNANPPYTLYRITFDDQAREVRTPMADNIRSMVFKYYQDGQGVTPLQDLAGADVSDGTAVLGLGQYDPTTPNALVAQRVVRTRVKSVRLTLVGMTEAPDYEYQDTTDLASLVNFRKYRLESLVAPRNVGKRGLREQDTNAPGAPTLTRVGFGHCGLVRVQWTAPVAGGAVEQYAVLYDTDLVGGFANTQSVGLTFEAVIPIPPTQISQTWYFTVAAQNSFGTTPSLVTPFSGIPLNRTKPEPVTAINATPSASAISLTWDLPAANVSGQDLLSWEPGSVPEVDPNGIPNAEITDGAAAIVRVFRGATAAFAPVPPPAANANTVWTETSTGLNIPLADVATRTVVWSDLSAAHCTDYFYRVQVLDHCGYDVTENFAAPNGFSDYYPLAANNAVGGWRTSTTSPPQPAKPTELTIDSTSACDVSGNCTIKLAWPKVIADATQTVPMTIDVYKIEVQRLIWDDIAIAYVVDPATGANQVLTETGFSFDSGATATYEVTNLPQADPVSGVNYQYEVKVRAVSCDEESDASDPRRWPCVFTGGSPVISTDVLDGSGTAANPWLVYGAPTIDISGLNSNVTAVTASLLKVGVPVASYSQSGPFTTGSTSFTLPDLDDDDIPYSLSITMTDASSCSLSAVRYLLGSTSSCCIVRHTPPDSIQIHFSAGSDDVEIDLENQCDDGLAIATNGLKFKYSSAGLAGGTRVDGVEYPPISGSTAVLHNLNTTASPFTSTPPGGAQATIHGRGFPWEPGATVAVGDVVVPTPSTGFKYVATSGGTTGSTQPTFPTVLGNTVNDNGVVWQTVPLLYKIRVLYTKNLPLNPIKDVCVTYTRGADAATICKVIDLNPTPTNTCD
jgi:prepilin-type N-terminal cleavage/methylation domain-containing protein